MGTHVGSAIEVNPARLHQFGVTVGDDVHKHVRPHAEHLTIVFSDGVMFGSGNPSTDLQAAAEAYQACLQGVSEQLVALPAAVAVLADSAQEIAARYASTDALASAKAKDVQQVLEAAAAIRSTPATSPVTRYQ